MSIKSTSTNKSFAEFLIKLRDAASMMADATNEYIETFAQKGDRQAVAEECFNVLTFESQQGVKLGTFEVAKKNANNAEKWQSAFNILKEGCATIQNRYHGKGYFFSFWLYGEDKIYRQKLKEA